MTEEDKAKIAVATAAAKAKAKEIVSRENIDKVKDSVKNGVESLKTAEGRQRLKKSVIAGATAAKNKVVETWKSGPKGKGNCRHWRLEKVQRCDPTKSETYYGWRSM